MTNEQIKQNAEAYADSMKEIRGELEWCATRDDFIAGAHSRDREVMDLEHLLKAEMTTNKALAEANNQLRNPWISVEERLPEIGDIVVINVHNTIDGGGEHHEDDQILVEKYDGRWICDRCEQHRIGKYLFDTISKTTHWMPIPPIEKYKTITLC